MARSKKGKTRGPGDWQYSARLKHSEQVPLLTTRSGVQAVLLSDGVPLSVAIDFVNAIDQGGSYEPTRGLFKNIHRMLPTVEEQLRFCCAGIKHDGIFGVCWWHRVRCEVWWCYHAPDDSPARIITGEATALYDIRKLFNGVKEVRAVRLEREGQPDPHRDPGWVKVYSGR
jgi:hypothetical protein